MEPNNIEKLIQDNFKDRHIEPSSQARERLIIALNSKPKKKKKLWIHYAVAASLVLGLIFVGGTFLFHEGVEKQAIEISYEKDVPKETQQQHTSDSVNHNKAIVLEAQQDSEQEPKIRKQFKIASNLNETVSKNTVTKQDIETTEEAKLLTENSTIVIDKDLVKAKESEDIAVIKSPQQFQYITAEELLASTGKDSSLNLIQNKKQLSDSYLNADQLLLEMEKELFDEKNKSIFKKAGKQLKQINEAVANRNYEHNN
ncbi:hypothetical protein DFQ09_11084 [Winogradskyella pacifica]|uniref:Uncharacterized protein n=1 Tax=Winogradskyella pacifica TaxID=664642 RepID=A0A3D9LMA7_9FLAO|nr:hypothetical protein [Winogradskyella pacifica]REE07890.1 hypothetical protein DFQ09_11084 [Winogradskyella pacifica]